MTKRLDTYKGTETGLPTPYADDPVMISRTGSFSSFDGSNSYNIARAQSHSSYDTAGTDYDGNNILIHSIQFINTNNDNHRFIYFYEQDDSTNANARNATNRIFYLGAAFTDAHVASNSVTIHFPIPLVIRQGCRITANGAGPIVNVNYTVLNSTSADDYSNKLKYKFLTADSHNSETHDAIHTTKGDEAGDIELWGGIVFNISTTSDDYNNAWVTSTGDSDARHAYITSNEHEGDDDANAAYTGTYQPFFFPYPVLLRGGAKMDVDDTETYATWFYRLRKSKDSNDYGWI